MIDVIRDADIFAKECFAYAPGKARALVFHGRRRKVIKKKTRQIQHGRGFQDDRVPAGIQLHGILRALCFFAGRLGQRDGIDRAHVGCIGFRPTCRAAVLHGDRKLRLRLPVRREKAARVAQHRLALPALENSRRHLAIAFRQFARPLDRTRALFRRQLCRGGNEALQPAILLFAGQGQQVRIFRLARRQGQRTLQCRAQRILFHAIGRHTSGPPIHHGANRDGQAVLRDILVNRIIGKARERIHNLFDVDFRLFHSAQLCQTQNRGRNGAQFTHVAECFTVCLCLFCRRSPYHVPCADSSENAEPIFTFRKRAGDAPCPVPIVCIGWPLPQFGVPHSSQ